MSKNYFRTRNAFTLIELAVVMTIVSMLAVALSFRLLGPWTAATIEADIDRIVALDDFARQTAIHDGTPLQLEFDQDENVIHLVRKKKDDRSIIRTCRLSRSSRIGEIRMSPRGTDKNNRPEIVVSAIGSSLSYALLIVTDHREKWILVVGQTGQILDTTAEQDVEFFLSNLVVK